jgi:CPA1 family monovalent cation:H+ antiporter
MLKSIDHYQVEILLTLALVVGGSAFASVGIPVFLFRTWRDSTPHVVKIMTWGGLRGGISVALALSLPAGAGREFILTITYAVVVFSILVQGLTITPLLRTAMPVQPQEAEQVPVA